MLRIYLQRRHPYQNGINVDSLRKFQLQCAANKSNKLCTLPAAMPACRFCANEIPLIDATCKLLKMQPAVQWDDLQVIATINTTFVKLSPSNPYIITLQTWRTSAKSLAMCAKVPLSWSIMELWLQMQTSCKCQVWVRVWGQVWVDGFKVSKNISILLIT